MTFKLIIRKEFRNQLDLYKIDTNLENPWTIFVTLKFSLILKNYLFFSEVQ